LAIVLIVLVAAWWHAHKRNSGTGVEEPGIAAEIQPVQVAKAVNADVPVVLNALGTVTPLATVTVKTQINGRLQAVGFTEGQIVHVGDFLAQVDPRPYEALLEQAQGQLARDQALLAQAQLDLGRYQALLGQDSIARQQAENQAFVVRQYQASIRSDQGQVDAQKLNLTYCRITSPVNGQVGLRQVDPGNYVQTTDSSGIVVITQLQPMSVVFPLPEDVLPEVLHRFRGGAGLSVALYDRANDKQLSTGRLVSLDNQVDATTGTWKLRAVFPNTDGMLFPSQFVNAHLLVNTLRGVLTVPSAAVQRGAPGTYVYLLQADKTVKIRAVTTGATDGERVTIGGGLQTGDSVVISGADRLHDGAKVLAQDSPRAEAEADNRQADDSDSAAPGRS
jgi:multidrug efflux system membrane fusion protein